MDGAPWSRSVVKREWARPPSCVRFVTKQPGRERSLWGTCDPLFTPRPFGPLFAIAEGTGGELGPALAQGANPHQVALALARELRSAPPMLLVLEDLHWADEATLDVFTLLVRRADAIPALVVGTYRDDALENAHPLRQSPG